MTNEQAQEIIDKFEGEVLRQLSLNPGMTKPKATRAAIIAKPDLHGAYIAACNPNQPAVVRRYSQQIARVAQGAKR